MTIRKINTGFTLLELMITVAILGILAAIAIPSYANFTKRAYVSDGLSSAMAIKFAVYEYFINNATWPVDNAAAQINAPETFTSQSVKSIAIDSGNIIITYNSRTVDNATLILAPTTSGGTISWDCSTGTIPTAMRPPVCHPKP